MTKINTWQLQVAITVEERQALSYVESSNKSILPGHHLHPTAAVVIWLVDKIQSRFELNHSAAVACSSDLPPLVMEDMRKPKEQAAGIWTGQNNNNI
jgi:hypothetical protein